jgi:hypothetical protein
VGAIEPHANLGDGCLQQDSNRATARYQSSCLAAPALQQLCARPPHCSTCGKKTVGVPTPSIDAPAITIMSRYGEKASHVAGRGMAVPLQSVHYQSLVKAAPSLSDNGETTADGLLSVITSDTCAIMRTEKMPVAWSRNGHDE